MYLCFHHDCSIFLLCWILGMSSQVSFVMYLGCWCTAKKEANSYLKGLFKDPKGACGGTLTVVREPSKGLEEALS